jgi:hypothetical protein
MKSPAELNGPRGSPTLLRRCKFPSMAPPMRTDMAMPRKKRPEVVLPRTYCKEHRFALFCGSCSKRGTVVQTSQAALFPGRAFAFPPVHVSTSWKKSRFRAGNDVKLPARRAGLPGKERTRHDCAGIPEVGHHSSSPLSSVLSPQGRGRLRNRIFHRRRRSTGAGVKRFYQQQRRASCRLLMLRYSAGCCMIADDRDPSGSATK